MVMVEADLLSQTCIYMGEHIYIASVTGTRLLSRLISITVASSLQLVRPVLILSAM